jgi:hypothetical protein
MQGMSGMDMLDNITRVIVMPISTIGSKRQYAEPGKKGKI